MKISKQSFKILLSRSYISLFAKPSFAGFNRTLMHLGAQGLGILDLDPTGPSGEIHFHHLLQKYYKTPIVFDVGAHRGNYSAQVKSLIPGARVFAFEPHPETFQRLQSLATQLGFQAINCACGDEAGTLTLYDYADAQAGTSHASLYREVIEEIQQAPDSKGYEVRVQTLDDFAKDNHIDRVHLLKIDTEGHEMMVLRGATDLLRNAQIDYIHFEFNEMNVVSRTFFRDFLQYLPGYKFYRMLPDALLPLDTYMPFYNEIFAYQNIISVNPNVVHILNQ